MDRQSKSRLTHPSFSASFWAFTCYFNPIGYRQRLADYRILEIGLPLLTVELSHNGDYHLHPRDAEILVQK